MATLGGGVGRHELMSDDPAERSVIEVMQESDQWKQYQIEESWASRLQGPGCTGAGSGVPGVESLGDDVLANILPEKIRARIFGAFPLRVLKLPEMKLAERSVVAEYIVRSKLKKLWEEIPRKNEAISAFVEDVTKFAILSHTWGRDELKYEDFIGECNTTDSEGYKKLKKFCRVAHEQYGAEFAWADTVCINKTSSSELDESIRSMFTWYRESFVCIIYLANTDTLLDFPFDRWFMRGWTLQELLASRRIKFYNKSWRPLANFHNDKLDPNRHPHLFHPFHTLRRRHFDKKPSQLELLGTGISIATGIPIRYICNFKPGLRDPPVPERMKWIARRITTRPEDMSYSMMGVLGVSIPIAYGEGSERAFFRLFQAVLEVDWSPSWFLWGGKPVPSYIHPSKMIPSSPACYLSWNPKCDSQYSSKKEPIVLTNAGLQIKVLVVPASMRYPLATFVSSGQRQDPYITCPLSNDIVTMANIPIKEPRDMSGEFQFALGILDYHSERRSTQECVYGILLCRYYGRVPSFSDESVYSGSEWGRCEMGETISFRLKDEIRQIRVDDSTTIKIDRSEVGWGSKGGDIVPEIKLQSVYL